MFAPLSPTSVILQRVALISGCTARRRLSITEEMAAVVISVRKIRHSTCNPERDAKLSRLLTCALGPQLLREHIKGPGGLRLFRLCISSRC